MRLIKCDKHPDRDAVATFKIIELPVGSRPFILGSTIGIGFVDLCEECASYVRGVKDATG